MLFFLPQLSGSIELNLILNTIIPLASLSEILVFVTITLTFYFISFSSMFRTNYLKFFRKIRVQLQ